MRLPAVAIAPEEAAVLRAMLLFDRSFLHRFESVNLATHRAISKRSALSCRMAGAKTPVAVVQRTTQSTVWTLPLFLRVAEMIILILVLQLGMLPLPARDFHRVTLSGPLANLFAVPLTEILVPLGFVALILGLIFPFGRLICRNAARLADSSSSSRR
jgi:hypothetical protein